MRYCDTENCWNNASKQLLNDRDEIVGEHCGYHMDQRVERIRNIEYFRILPIKSEAQSDEAA